jgi:hypothetical protein
MVANGPAIWGGCVTRRNSGQSRFPKSGCKLSLAGKGGYGALFAVVVQVLWALRVSRYKFDRSQKTITVQNFCWGHWRSVAVLSCLGARNLSRCRNLIASRCVCPGATAITNLSWEKDQKQKVWQTTYPYCPCYGLGIFIFIGDRKVPRNASLYILIKTNNVNVIRK